MFSKFSKQINLLAIPTVISVSFNKWFSLPSFSVLPSNLKKTLLLTLHSLTRRIMPYFPYISFTSLYTLLYLLIYLTSSFHYISSFIYCIYTILTPTFLPLCFVIEQIYIWQLQSYLSLFPVFDDCFYNRRNTWLVFLRLPPFLPCLFHLLSPFLTKYVIQICMHELALS